MVVKDRQTETDRLQGTKTEPPMQRGTLGEKIDSSGKQ